MNAAQIKEEVEACRRQWPVLAHDALPIDILSCLELDLGLDIIPAPDLPADAAFAQDWSGIYVNEGDYADLDKNPPSMRNRLRFTLAHEFAHWYLHRPLTAARSFRSLRELWTFLHCENGAREWEANEFAGQLLVPADSLREKFEDLALLPRQMTAMARLHFARKYAPLYGVNRSVVEIRLGCEGIWPAL